MLTEAERAEAERLRRKRKRELEDEEVREVLAMWDRAERGRGGRVEEQREIEEVGDVRGGRGEGSGCGGEKDGSLEMEGREEERQTFCYCEGPEVGDVRFSSLPVHPFVADGSRRWSRAITRTAATSGSISSVRICALSRNFRAYKKLTLERCAGRVCRAQMIAGCAISAASWLEASLGTRRLLV